MPRSGDTPAVVRALWLIVSEGATDFVRYPAVALASVGSAAVTLVLVGIFLIAAANVAGMSEGVASQVGLRVFLSRDLSKAAEVQFGRSLRQLPCVRTVSFESRAQALAQMRREFASESAVFAALGSANPLLDSYGVTFCSPAASTRAARTVGRWRGVARLIFPGQAAERLSAILSLVRWTGAVVAALLAVSSFLVISNAVRLAVYGRRRELEIMLLVGATRAAVRGPFVVEGMLFGAAGGAVATVVALLGYRAAAAAVTRAAPFIPLVTLGHLWQELVLALLGGGLVLGYLGSAFALRRLVRVAGDA
jgi:cell division transport system permease protein